VNIEQGSAHLGLACFFRRGIRDLGHRNAELVCHHAHGFGKSDVLDLLEERIDISRSSAAEAVEELAFLVNGKRTGLFLMEWAQPDQVLPATLAQPYVFPDDPDDVGLLFEGGGEVAGRSHGDSVPETVATRQ